MQKKGVPSCPFCGMRLGRLESFIIKNKSLYKCAGCGRTSAVILKSSVYKYLWITQILSAVIFIVSLFLGEGFYLLGLGLILVVFGFFYWRSTGMISLEEPEYKEQKAALQKNRFLKNKKI